MDRNFCQFLGSNCQFVDILLLLRSYPNLICSFVFTTIRAEGNIANVPYLWDLSVFQTFHMVANSILWGERGGSVCFENDIGDIDFNM